MAKARHARPSKMRATAKAAAAAAPVGIASLAIAAPAYAATPGQIHQANQIVPLPGVIYAVRGTVQPPLYTVRSGDSLSQIAEKHCGTPGDWTGIYVRNKHQIANPDEIYPGEHLALDCRQVQGVTDPGSPVHQQAVATDHASYHGYSSGGSYSGGGGTLSYGGLESLWESAGGPAWAASHAAEIAECESGGRQYAYNPSGASGYWQILGEVVPGYVFNPMVNAENAVAKFKASGDTFAQWVCQ